MYFAAGERAACSPIGHHQHMPHPDVPASVVQRADFDAEGRKLIESFGLTPAVSRYNDMDAIWRDATTGGVIFVGNETAAKGPASKLRALGITHVVNCTDNMANFCEQPPATAPRTSSSVAPIQYLRWNIAYWQAAGQKTREQPASAPQIAQFVETLLHFVDAAVADGGGVLVHCLAGAHRAGTTGCLLLMHKHGLGAADSIKAAKQLRPAINPIGSLPLLLQVFEGHSSPARDSSS